MSQFPDAVCGVCAMPVSSKPEKSQLRTLDPITGRWCHKGCLQEPSPEESLLHDIFGNPGVRQREHVAINEMARRLGHEISLVSNIETWRCSCGYMGSRCSNKAWLKSEAREHLRSIITEQR